MSFGQRVLWLLATVCYLTACAILVSGLAFTVRIASQHVDLTDLGKVLQAFGFAAFYQLVVTSIHDAITFAATLVLAVTVAVSALFTLIGWLFGSVRRLARRVSVLESRSSHDL